MSSYVNKRAQGVPDLVLKSLELPANFVAEVARRQKQEVEEDEEMGNRFTFAGYKKGPGVTRKEKRKLAKKEKKVKKQQHHMRKMGKVMTSSSNANVGNKRRRDDDEEIDSDIGEDNSIEEPPKKKVRFAAEREEREFTPDPPAAKAVPNKKQRLENKIKEENKFIKSLNKNEPESEEELSEENNADDTSNLVRLYDRTRAEEDERDLRMLEKKLGLKKGRKIGDGLDELLAGITSGGGSYKVKTNKKIIPDAAKATYDWEALLDYDSGSEEPQEIGEDNDSNSEENEEDNSEDLDEENFNGADNDDDENNQDDSDDNMDDEGNMDGDMEEEFNSDELAAFDDENRGEDSDEDNGEMNGEFDDENDGSEGDGNEENEEDDEGDDEMDAESDQENNGKESERKGASNKKESIYGDNQAKIDSLAGSTMKYIPPHLRRASEQDQAYKRQLRGHLNKIADNNLIKTLEIIEQLYTAHPRSEMNETLSEFILSDCSDPQLHFTSGALLTYSALIASLHTLIGIEVGGHFIDKLAKRFNQFYNEKNTKLCKNLLVIFIHLYNFEIINPSLLFDLTNVMINNFNEEDIELLLVLVKHAGSKLRADDPSSVKEMLVNMYTKASEYKKKKDELKKKDLTSPNKQTTAAADEDVEEGKRIDFMIEMLMDLKNNKMRLVIDKEANINLTNLKRAIKNYMKQRGKESIDEVRITWKDLTSEETKGRWWLVGSGWSRASSGKIGGSTSESDAPVTLNMNEYDAKLLEVARKQRMNTDLRRAIFCIVMGSEDYLDAFEKLVRLGLKNKQERDIVFVIIHCCSVEKKFNPFYAHLAMKLCSYSHNFKFTFKFTFWDKFKDIEGLELRALSNLAHLLAQLLGSHTLSLSILKVVSFESLEPKSIVFFKILMVSLMNDFEVETVMAVFQRLASAPKTKQLKDGLDLFFMQVFTKSALNQIKDEAQRKREERASKIAKMARKAMRDKQVALF